MNPNTNIRNNRVICSNSTSNVLSYSTSLANRCLDNGQYVPLPPAQQTNGNRRLAIQKTTRGGLGRVSMSFGLKTFGYIANISNSNGSDLIGTVLCRQLTLSLGQTHAHPKRRSTLRKLRRLSGIVSVSRSPVNHAPHSGPTACAKIFGSVHSLCTSATSTGVQNCSTNHFSFGIGKNHYRTYRNSNVLGVRVGFLPSMFIPYRIYRKGQCGQRALRIGCGNGSVTSMLSVAMRRKMTFFTTVPGVTHGLRALLSIKLNCIGVKRPTAALSNNRTRQIGLTARLSHRTANHAICVLSRPAANLRTTSIRRLVSILRHLISNNGAIVIVRRGLSIIGATSRVVSLNPRKNSNNNALITYNAPRSVTTYRTSCANRCLGRILTQRGGPWVCGSIVRFPHFYNVVNTM